MWLYCRRFDLVWNREQCQKNFESYFGVAYKLANSSAEYNQLRDLRDMWKDQMREIKSETKSIGYLKHVQKTKIQLRKNLNKLD